MAIIHGARGLIYFAHEFQPKFIEAGMLAYPEMAKGIAGINAGIRDLAPVVNSPAIADGATAGSSSKTTSIDILTKRYNGATYVFAVAMRDEAVTGSFAIPGLKGDAKVEALGESRTISASDGKWRDEFKGYQVHLYRVGAVAQ